MTYLSLTNLKLFLSISVTTYDALLTLILDGVEQAIETYVGRGPLARASAIEYYSPSGEAELVLDRYPLVSPDDIAEVAEDWNGNWGQTSGAFASGTVLTKGESYAVKIDGVSKRGVLIRLGGGFWGSAAGVWPYSKRYPPERLSGFVSPSNGPIRVTYTAGWSESAPADVIAAAYAEAAARWKLTPFGFGFPTSEGVAGASASIALIPQTPGKYGPFITETLQRAVQPYRRIPVGGR